MKAITLIVVTFFLSCGLIYSDQETLSVDKIAVIKNEKLTSLRNELAKKHLLAKELFEKQSDEKGYKNLINEIKLLKKEIVENQEEWRSSSKEDSLRKEQSYDYWDQGETTLSSLIMEYGSTDYLYIIPYELGSLKLHLYSSIPIPHESWDEMLASILINNGIGIKKLNPYLRQLYILKHDPSHIEAISHSIEDLDHVPDKSMVFHVFTPDVEQLKSSQVFFERFSDPKQTNIQVIKQKIVLIGIKENICRLLKLHSAVSDKEDGKTIKVLSPNKLQVSEAEKVLRSFFQEGNIRTRPSLYQTSNEELQFFTLSQNNQLVLIGPTSLIEKGERIIEELERQVVEPGEMTIYWYTCKHSDPDDIAKILNQVYSSLSGIDFENKDKKAPKEEKKQADVKVQYCPTSSVLRSSAYNPVMPVAPGTIEPGKIEEAESSKAYGNFIVDDKTGSILMVIRRNDLSKIKALLKKMDVPKKMAQIDVLLVEKKLQERTQSGINILKIGTGRDVRETSLSFDDNPNAPRKGILDFVISRPKTDWPIIDFAMNFLMTQNDIRINANPSVVAVNQTPATISIVEELSINNGAIQLDTSCGVTVEKSYTRAQYGITLVMTPTIHLPTDKNSKGYVTLQTNVTFDTTQSSDDDRPPVTRRHVENEVRIADGETVILGGLRRLSSEDTRDKIPFLGDIPGVGKLFGTTTVTESTTEMFIFITPRIIQDPIGDLKKIRQETLEKRPGDIPEFLRTIEAAKKAERRKLFENSIKVFFDKVDK
jgi:general secretion pathway protein D